jgi:DNA-dependent metalloprotease WSS1
LTHNVHGPHDDRFYKFLAGLEAEYDELQRSGYSGEGFFSKGARVGEGVSHDLPPHLARLKALEAAEKRRRAAALTSGSGSKLGGRKIAKTPRELAAEVGVNFTLVLLHRESFLTVRLDTSA